jgi:hypothetical protein
MEIPLTSEFAKNSRSPPVAMRRREGDDRNPTAGRIIDLSSAAARKIGMSRPGLRQVTLEVLSQPAAKTRKAAKQ